MINRVLGKNRQFVGLNHLRNTMIDFRVHMIWSADQHDGLLPGLFYTLQDSPAVSTHIFTIMLDFNIGRFHSSRDFLSANAFFLPHFLKQALCQAFFVMNRQEGLNKVDILFTQNVHIATNIFRIGRHNGTVEMVIRLMNRVLHIVRSAGVENLFYALFHQVHDMTMRNLGWITQGIRGHGSHALIVHLSAGFARQLHPIA